MRLHRIKHNILTILTCQISPWNKVLYVLKTALLHWCSTLRILHIKSHGSYCFQRQLNISIDGHVLATKTQAIRRLYKENRLKISLYIIVDYIYSGYDQNGSTNYNWDMGPTSFNENTHHGRQIGVFKTYLRLTSRPAMVQVIIAILGGGEEGYMATLKDDDNK